CGGLQEDEDELEGGVAEREVEPRDLRDPGKPADERGEEEEREQQRREQERRVREEVVHLPPRDASRDVDHVVHERASRWISACVASVKPISDTPIATAKASRIGSQCQS